MNAPEKPFPTYKWRWATVLPTESLNNPVVFHGVLRVLAENEGLPPSSATVAELLRAVQRETKTTVDLVRTPERNLIRNSGQYWKALDLLGDLSGAISLTDFGRRVASGGITKTEFALTVVKTLELPNRRIEQNTVEWDRAGLRIKPLELLINILNRAQEQLGVDQAYLTPFELIRIVIPLAAVSTPVEQHIEALQLYRRGALDPASWPDCAPGANDKRMAREFLWFLANYGFCIRQQEGSVQNERFVLCQALHSSLEQFSRLDLTGEESSTAVRRVREEGLPSIADRERILAEVTARPHQRVFRNNVLAAYSARCLITGVALEAVLEASHIMPVPRGGNDLIENGLCLRSDIHHLYDSGHLRINASGSIHLSEVARQSSNYGSLPGSIAIPDFVRTENVEWRWRYY